MTAPSAEKPLPSAIRFEVADHVATIMVDKPTRRNALDREDIADLCRAIDQVVHARSGVRAVVIGGSNGFFCSGLNLRRMIPTASGMAEQEGELKRTHFHNLILRLAELRVPTIAAVEGPAVGAGMSLAVACTLAVMARGSYFEPSVARLGLVPDGGLTFYLPRKVGAARAARILLTDERVDAEAAVAMGLASHVADEGHALDDAMALARRVAAQPVEAIAMTSILLRESLGRTLSAQLHEEKTAQTSALTTANCKEGVTAFLQKRAPVFNQNAR